uniref:NADH dehydrogenase [ubiquinone] 1 alpha subcomplex subunit 10, mitochondrial n=1 Tax=Cacopsylla melanoneura TaxID=428564 RepID=A0A8D9EPA6_9HEMI
MSTMLSVSFVKLLTRGSQHHVPVLSAVRCISSKHSADVSRPAPYPYKERDFRFPWTAMEDTEDRLNENSKIIVVEGPIASGKTEFCKKLADELDMLALPPANMDMWYKQGDFDFRSLDHLWSTENMKSFDEKSFCKDPKHLNTMGFQIRMLQLRFSLYVDALAHMLSTGQGVVLQRSPFSDFVFVEAMDSAGYISKRVKDIYNEILQFTMLPLLKPHLVIYLDIPPSIVKENIKKRNNPWEVNSPILNDTYLNKIEEVYKNKYLPNINNHSELLVYDWSEGGDVEVVVEDIERIDFDHYDHFSDKLREWRELTTKEWNEKREIFADQKQDLMMQFNTIERYDAPELYYTGDETLEYIQKLGNVPEYYYQKGFNPEKNSVLWRFDIDKKQRFPTMFFY